MKCAKYEKLIDPYISGDLSPGERSRLESHLEHCDTCRELVSEFQVLDAMLDSAFEWNVEPPPYLARRVMANFPDRPASAFWSWRFLHPYMAAVSLVLAVGLGFPARDMLTGPRHVISRTRQVRIIFFSPEASSVALIGDFNQWGQRDVTIVSCATMNCRWRSAGIR